MNTDNKASDRRHFSRVHFETDIRLSHADGIWSCELIDLSLKGVLVKRPDNFSAPEASPFVLEMPLSQSDITISMELKLAHESEDCLGFNCEHIDLDSIAHLKRLMELNLGDAELVYRELSDLGDFD